MAFRRADFKKKEDEMSDQKAGRTLQDRALEVGRDGAYVEADCESLIGLSKSGDLDAAQMVVIKAGRVDFSQGDHVTKLKHLCKSAANGRLEGFTGMDDRQASFALFRKIFEAGLDSLTV